MFGLIQTNEQHRANQDAMILLQAQEIRRDKTRLRGAQQLLATHACEVKSLAEMMAAELRDF